MFASLTAICEFLIANRDVMMLLADAFTAGVTKEELIKAVTKLVVEANDAAMKKELGDT